MKTAETKHYISVAGTDENGEFEIQIQNDCSQLRIRADNSDVFIDVDYNELKTIRNAITQVLDGYFQHCNPWPPPP